MPRKRRVVRKVSMAKLMSALAPRAKMVRRKPARRRVVGRGFFKSLFNKVLKPVGNALYKGVIKPSYSAVLKPTYEDVLRPGIKSVASAGKDALSMGVGQLVGRINPALGNLASKTVDAIGTKVGIARRRKGRSYVGLSARKAPPRLTFMGLSRKRGRAYRALVW